MKDKMKHSLYRDDGGLDVWSSVRPVPGRIASDRGSNGDDAPSRALALTLAPLWA